jgi:membrane carboxypeptidase/penicillin-binding protein
MGNPLRKESLGRGMTGGGGALPYFNAFMIPFMKDKERDTFPDPPPMPPEIRRESEMRKREELEKLEKAEQEGRKLGNIYNTPRISKDGSVTNETTTDTVNDLTTTPDTSDPSGKDPNPKPVSTPRQNEDRPQNRPGTSSTPVRETQPERPKSEGSKRKGKKGDGDN